MKIPFVDLYAQYLSIKPEIDAAIATVIAESSFIRGAHVDKFEQEFAQAIGVEHCVSCANGTDALYIAMKGLGLRQGDEVITTAHSWISTSETITQAGGRVVFCDTDRATFNIDPAHIESKITSRTVGIIPVHLFGQAADMEAIQRIAKKNNLWIIEDCAQAHLAKYKGQTVGTFGNAATFSFYPGKNLGAMGDAGCLVTNNLSLAEWAKLYARHGGKGDHQIEGINSRLDGLQAAILCAKLPHLAKWTDERQRVANQYDKALAAIPGLETPIVAENRSHVYHLYVIRCDDRDDLKSFLEMKGVSSTLNYPKALPFYPAYKYLGHTPEEFPEAFANQFRILSLPIFPEIKYNQISYICSKISEFKKFY